MITRILSLFFLFAVTLQAQDIPDIWEVTIEVNQHDPAAKDDDPTTPFKTIQAAATNALGFARAGRNVQVRIYPGIYRVGQGVLLESKEGQETGWIKFEGTEPGKITINGSELINGWKINDDNMFVAPNKYGSRDLTLFVEGARMLPVDTVKQVTSGRMFVDDENIYLIPPKGAVVVDGKVEIARSSYGIKTDGVSKVFFESLSFERTAGTGLGIAQAEMAVVNNIASEYNGGQGVAIADTKQARLRRVFAERNGNAGLQMTGVGSVVLTG